MKKSILLTAAIAGLMSTLAPMTAQAADPATTAATSDAKHEPYPLDYFAVRDSMSNVSLSPDGKYMAFMKISSKKGNPVIYVYETENLKKKPYRVGDKKLEITGFSWVGDDQMIVGFRGRIRKKIKGFNDGVFKTKLAVFDMESKKFSTVKQESAAFEAAVYGKPNTVRVSVIPNEKEGRIVNDTAFRPRTYYELNLKTGAKKLILKGNTKYRDIRFDGYGNPRRATYYDEGSELIRYYHRKPSDGKWTQVYSKHEDNFETFAIVAYKNDDPSRVYVIAHNGNDKRGLWIFNVDTKKFEELVYRRKDVDVASVRFHSNRREYPGKVIGVSYNKDVRHIKFFDQVEGATIKQLKGLIPNAGALGIVTRSRDGNTFVVVNNSPRDPGSYYLYNNGKFNLIGQRKGLLKADNLATVKYIEYTARDGRKIPGYITVPNGKGPFPLVVMPHGGPFIAESIFYFDEWAQLMANNGYMVLQPQYRGSHGHGLDHYTSAFLSGGQGGFKMQDDKDDGAQYLVSEGLVDSKRIAMFGWSYGGYAAMVAASRSPNIYQCVIAGAGVADTNQQVNYYRFQIEGVQKIEQLAMWDDSLSPIKDVENVNVPLLIIHGDVDQRVPFKHYKKYTSALDKANVPYQSLVLEGADHFGDTLTYDHKITFFTKLIDYLKNDCGPGGL